jgi:hypothetical protein
MRNTILGFVLTLMLLPACVFAVDGVVLINQSTVMAAGGFPYVISQAGSYKLSGNLTMTTSQTGNLNANQSAAILITSSGVSLDLNGFSITVNNSFNIVGNDFHAIVASGPLHEIKISNGTITLTSVDLTALAGATYAIYMGGSTYYTLENLSISAQFYHGGGILGGPHGLIRRNTLNVQSYGGFCPSSLVLENVGVDQNQLNGLGCVAFLNAP